MLRSWHKASTHAARLGSSVTDDQATSFFIPKRDTHAPLVFLSACRSEAEIPLSESWVFVKGPRGGPIFSGCKRDERSELSSFLTVHRFRVRGKDKMESGDKNVTLNL